jgi:hypothetical protein
MRAVDHLRASGMEAEPFQDKLAESGNGGNCNFKLPDFKFEVNSKGSLIY